VHAAEPRYWAFISYSHHDARSAAALQRALETYRVPHRLIGRSTPLGEVPAYLKPVFRDRSELQAGADLTATVREALTASRYLIVVCSPSAARSSWVNREISEFKKLYGDGRVLALIVAGEPFASRIPGREDEECFPEALRHSLAPDGQPSGAPLEPVAADLRRGGDGRRLAMLKLVAGMLGTGVDELVHRDAQRHARHMAIIATAAIAGMAVTSVLTVTAIRARTEARLQHAQAEDLLEFMLGDLRKKLEPAGRLDVLDSVGEKVLDYYDRQPAEGLDAGSLGRRSRALHLIGEIREQRGKLAEALTAFNSAAATTAQALARAPNDGQRIYDHAQSVFWVGAIALRRGQLQQTERAFLEYRDLAQRLVQIDPSRADWRMEVAWASQNLGVVQLATRQAANALRSFSVTRDEFTRLLAVRPEVAFELADAHGWVAQALEASGDYAAAIDAQQTRLAVLRGMPDATRDSRVRLQMANTRYDLARLKLSLGNAPAAEEDARAALTQTEVLVEEDTSNLVWLAQACFDRLRLADIELALGRATQAESLIERAGKDVARLVASDASALNWNVDLQGLVVGQRARIALAERRAVSRAELQNYVAQISGLESSGIQFDSGETEIVAAAELLAGDAANRDGDSVAARAHWTAAAHRLQAESAGHDYAALTLLGRAQLRLGDFAAARRLLALVGSSSYRHPAYAEFANELAQAGGAGRVSAKR
jgi:tetratricopeptide (TPR) repeat protein